MRKKRSQLNTYDDSVRDLFAALLSLKNIDEIERFLKDLCTPQEIKALAERWRVCRLLDLEELSYREINQLTGASVATIGRVARFLRTEPHRGYQLVLQRMRRKSPTQTKE
ncbi:TrpR like protein, YerC/YecD [Candidatus Dependentiae bacterium]|nr:TrpR like protein, YerC/YecD [Candidatus Dependentiae bacterium]